MGLARLPFARARQKRYMPDAVILTHADASTQATVCRFYPDGSLSTPIPGTEQVPRFRFYLPYATAVVVGDQLTLTGGVWSVAQVLDPQSFDTATLVYAYQRLDAAGNPLVPRPNATISVTRQDGTAITGGTSRRVRLLNPAESVERVLASGGSIARWILDTPDADYRINDVVTLTGLDGFAGPPDLTVLFVSSIDPASSGGVSWLEIGLSANR